MQDKNALLRTLPQVEELLEQPCLAPALEALPRQLVVEAARAVSRDLYRYRLSENAAP